MPNLCTIHGDNTLDYDGYLMLTRGIGHDPTDRNGENFRRFPHIKIVRLNNGYGSAGTIPLPQYYADFAQRVTNFVEASPGCSRWVIANEMNVTIERPDGVPITPAMYAECFNLCRDKIRALQGHEQDEVLIAAIGPWNVDTKYEGNPSGDWLRYFEDVQRLIDDCDGFAIHTYAREQTPESIIDTARMDPPFEFAYKGFLHYTNWMDAMHPRFHGLPVYCTEFCIAGEAWDNEDTGCIAEAYSNIDTWNQLYPGQPIHCLTVYRWSVDKWSIDDKPNVHQDFYNAVERGYSWPRDDGPPIPPEEDDLIKNPSLEGEYTIRDGQGEIRVAPEWNYGYWEPDHPSAKRPEWRAELEGVDSGRVLEGEKAQKWFWTFGIGEGWIWQRVEGTEPGKYYELRANVYVWSSDFDNADESVKPGKMWCRLGANPWGDGNARSLATEYGGAIVDNYDRWVELSTVFQAKSSAATVFLWSSPEHPAKHNDVYWDVVSLTEWECDGGTDPEPPDPPDPPLPGDPVDYDRIAQIVEDALVDRSPVVWPPA